MTSTVPVVFMATSDPVNRRLIATMEKPGGNFTGFIEFEPSIGAKWLELLKKIAPNVTRVAVLRDPTRFSWRSLVTAIEKAAPSLSVDITAIDARDAMQMERAITEFAGNANSGLIVTPSAYSAIFRERIIALRRNSRCRPYTITPFSRRTAAVLLQPRHDRSIPSRGRLR